MKPIIITEKEITNSLLDSPFNPTSWMCGAIFTEFDIKNRSGIIYNSEDYLIHIKYLKIKLRSERILKILNFN